MNRGKIMSCLGGADGCIGRSLDVLNEMDIHEAHKNGFPAAIMALSAILTRIEHRLEIVGLSATAASEAAGLSRDGIRNWQRRLKRGEDKAGMNVSSLEKLAAVLNTSVHWLQTGEGPEIQRSPEGIRIDREQLEEIVSKLTAASRYVREAAQEVEREVQ